MSNQGNMPAVVHYKLEARCCELREYPIPEIGRDDVLLKTHAVGICGSDVHQYHNHQSWKVNIPVILGHEFSGVIERVGGDVAGFAAGDPVVSETAAVIDPDSPFTRSGRYHLDPGRLGFGYGVDGAMATYVRVPARCLHRMPAGLSFEKAALTEPCCVAYQATTVNSPIRPGDIVAVIGPGPIGLLCAQVAKLRGAGAVALFGLSRDGDRLELAERHWATHTFDLSREESVPEFFNIGDGYGADVVIDAAGASPALELALKLIRPDGHITKVGWGPQPLGYSLDPLVQKSVTLKGSFSHTWTTWERVLQMLADGALDPSPLISKTASLESWRECFEGMTEGKYIKAVLTP